MNGHQIDSRHLRPSHRESGIPLFQRERTCLPAISKQNSQAVRTGKPTRAPSRTPAQETVPLCRHGPAIQCLTLLLWKSGFCKSTNFSLQIRHAFFLHFPHFFSPRICYFQKKMYLCSLFRGVLAQLARAFDWQSRGQGFDSPILHK